VQCSFVADRKKGDESQRASCRVGQEQAVDRGRSPAERPLVVVDSQTPSSTLASSPWLLRPLTQSRKDKQEVSRICQSVYPSMSQADAGISCRRGQVARQCSIIAVVASSSTPSFVVRVFDPTQSQQPTSRQSRAAIRDKGFDCYSHGSATAAAMAAQFGRLGV
jgi:hypothetical protein